MIINLKSKTDFSGFYIIFDGSTNIEEKGYRGATHLLEHLLCRQFTDLRVDLQKSGIDWNASTSSNHMRFYFTGLEEELSKFRKKLADRIINFDVTKKDFESEKKIVLEEYSSTFNNQYKRHFLNVLRKYFDSAAPIGYKKELEDLKWMDMIKFWENHYVNPSKIINVSKSYKYEDQSQEFMKNNITKVWQRGEFKNDLEKSRVKSSQESIIIFSDLVETDINKLKFISKMLSAGLESPLYKEAREKRELCYAIDTDVLTLNNKAALILETKTERENEKILTEVCMKVLENTKYLTKERFDIIKKSLIVQKKKREIDRYISCDDKFENESNSVFNGLETLKYEDVKDFYRGELQGKFMVSKDSNI